MSFLDPNIVQYIAAHTAGDDELLTELKRAASAAEIPAIWISPEEASVLQLLLRSAGARRVVEVGTLAGYSALQMARALPQDGLVDTIELSGKHADFAEEWIAKSDVAQRVRVHRGRGIDLLRTFESGAYDAAFLDADKESYGDYVEECLRLVRPGGLILVDNAFAFGQLLDEETDNASVLAIRAFNDRVAADARLTGVILPIGDGLWAATRGADDASNGA